MGYIRLGWDVVLILTLSFPNVSLQSARQTDKATHIDGSVGKMKGRRIHFDNETDISIFFGIPYAEPPVGKLRFAPPEEADCWFGTLDASIQGPACPQLQPFGMQSLTIRDDCLHLNVYAPSARGEAITERKKAVIMYVHGGNYITGHAGLYNFTNLAPKGVVIVTINYRLGPFGFLTTNDKDLPGNYGLRDVIMALEWVRNYIQDFGGDPGSITLFGHSSGASMVSMLTLSPLAKGKFHKAIMQSGSSMTEFAIRDTKPSNRLIEKLGCSETKTRLACLRGKTTQQILDAMRSARNTFFFFPSYTPVVDGLSGVLPDTPFNLLQDPALKPIPTLRGFTKDEANKIFTASFIPPKFFLSLGLAVVFGYARAYMVLDNVTLFYNFPKKNITFTTIEFQASLKPDPAMEKITNTKSVQAVTDALFVYPTIREAILYSRKNGKTKARTFLYRVDRYPNYKRGLFDPTPPLVAHGDDIGYFLNLPQGPSPFEFTKANGRDFRLADLLTTLVTNFAKHGNPTPTSVKNVMWNPFITDNPARSDIKCNREPHSPFERGLEYKFLRLKQTSKMSGLRECDKINFWSLIFDTYTTS